jgi:hypothetical protein
MGFPNSFTIAAGTTQGTNPLSTDFNICTSNIASGAVTLPASGFQYQVTDTIILVNHGANAIAVFPPTGYTIGTGAANASLSVPAGKTAWFLVVGATSFAASVSA